MTTDQIKYMVNRFLGWRLPDDFNPDAGISFKKTFNDHLPQPMKHEPLGTNLFDATQADAMVRYMLEGMPESSPSHTALAWREMADAPKDGSLFLAFSVTLLDEYDEDNVLIRKGVREEGYSILQFAFSGFMEVPWTGAIVTNRQFTHWMPLPPPPGTEPPQSINSGLLEAAKETASFIRNCNGGSRGERINLDRLANLLEVAISNAEKASSIAKAEREMGEG